MIGSNDTRRRERGRFLFDDGRGEKRSIDRKKFGAIVTQRRKESGHETRNALVKTMRTLGQPITLKSLTDIELGRKTNDAITVTTMHRLEMGLKKRFKIKPDTVEWDQRTTLGALFDRGGDMDFV